MNTSLQHLIDMPDDLGAYEPLIERGPIESLMQTTLSERDLIKAKAQTVGTMLQYGLEATLDDDEETVAVAQFNKTLQQQPIDQSTLMSPGVVLKLTALLSEYDHEIVRDAAQMRSYVTNRLLEESDPKMPAGHRLRALDMLGKISGVDLFTERTEITIKTLPTESLEAKLHDKLRVLLPEEFEQIAAENPASPQ